jgi:carboxypeptidase Q
VSGHVQALRAVLSAITVSAVVACSRGAPVAATPVPQLGARAVVDSASVAFLIHESAARSRVAADLLYLTDVIGPRLSGSAAMRRANEWMLGKLREYGADSVALEAWPFGVAWQRGPLAMRIVSPHERWITAASWAWSPGTNGPTAGNVMHMNATTSADFQTRFAGKLRGAWVMLAEPYPRMNPAARTPADSVRVDSLRRVRRERTQRLTAEQRTFLSELSGTLARERIAGTIIDGAKDFGLFTMSGSPDDISPYAQVVIANETYAALHGALERGDEPRVEVTMTNTIGRDTLVQWNTVGEIRGSERPDEIVILGAHLDSWDLGTGATDNAAGSIAVLEAARLIGALKASGIRPRRTIRFVLFSGEEQGLFGSRYYVLAHAGEMPRVQAVLVLDNGTGRIVAVPMQGRDELQDLWRTMLRPLSAVGPIAVRSGTKGGTDHLPFLAAGVPAFNYDQLSRGYDDTHHSQIDVLARAVPADIAQAATVMAVNALQLANLDILLPRGLRGR